MPMRPLDPVPGVARFTFMGLVSGVPVNNSIHVQRASTLPWPAVDLGTVLTALKTSFETRFLPLIQSNYHETGLRGLDLTNTTGADITLPMSGTGGKSNFSSNNAAACCVSWKTAAHYRGGHGRMYLVAGDASGILTGNTFESVYLSAMNTAANGFLNDIKVISMTPAVTPVLVRRTSNGVPLIPPLTYEITSAVVDSRVDTQRRRLGKDR